MLLVIPILALAVIAAVALAGMQQRLNAARQAVRAADAREATALRELAAARRQTTQAESDREFLSQFLRELPHVAHEMHASAGGRKVPSLLLKAVIRLLEPKRVLVAVARRAQEDEPDGGRSLAVAAVSPEGWVPIGTTLEEGRGEIGFAVEVQRVMSRRDLDAQPAPTRSRLRAQSRPDCQPDLVAPLVFKDEAVGVISVEAPSRYGPEVKDFVRLLAHIGAAALYSSARYSEINKTANTDGLTGLFNKGFVTLRLAEEIQKALAQARSVSVFLFDIDNFKHYNDRNGHVEGDRLLRALARVTQEATRGDTVFGRFGGEEFLMIFPGATRQQAVAAAENVREAIALYDFPAGAQQPLGCISISGGVAECPVDATDSAALVRLADEALYAAKRSGRNRVLAFEPRYLGGEDAQEPIGAEEAEQARRSVALGAYDASFAEARRRLAEGDTAGALEAARRARRAAPDRPAVVQFISAIEQQSSVEDVEDRDLIVVDEDEIEAPDDRARRLA